MSSTGSHLLQTNLTRYTLKERVGAGGMATVYRAWDNNLERDVAIKVLHEHLSFDSTFQERFEREAKFVASFNHPHIVQIFDFATIESDADLCIYYMVMPFLTGMTLEHVINNYRERKEQLPHDISIKLVQDIASALDYAHTRGMVHRDVKPANILYDDHSRAILTDFGIARLAETGNLTAEGMTIGTPAYMPPEQAQGLEVDHRADIYSLGVIAYELITGIAPYGEGSISVMLQHINAPIPQISDHLELPNDSLDRVIATVLAKNPEDRYQNATDFADDLANALHHKPISVLQQVTKVLEPVTTEPAIPPPSKPKRKNSTRSNSPIGFIAIGLGLVVFVLVVALFMQPESSPPPPATMDDISGIADSMTGDIFFTSTFDESDDMLSSWDLSDSQFINRRIIDGQYIITNSRANTASTSLFDQAYTYDNVTITLDANLLDTESLASGYGIVFRYQDAENYNVFAVDGRGRFSIWVRESGQWSELRNTDSNWQEHPAINPDYDNNTLVIDIYENTLTGLVNGEQVTQVQDDTLSTGGVGIYLATTPQGEATVAVESFTIAESIDLASAMTDASDDVTESMTSNE